jgi:hypothetical protein
MNLPNLPDPPAELTPAERWRLVLGPPPGGAEADASPLPQAQQGLDAALEALYGEEPAEEERDQRGGSNASQPGVVEALEFLREFCGASVFQVLQQDAVERVGLEKLLASPVLMENLEPNVDLVQSVLSLRQGLKGKNLENARNLVRRVVQALLAQIQPPLLQTLRGAARSAEKTNRPRLRDIDWHRTIRLNLKNYQADLGRIVPDRLVGMQRRNRGLDRVILCVDSSASMAVSLIYAAVYATVLARVPSLQTHLLLFDTAVADFSRQLRQEDPTDLLFQVQLGGGTDIAGALEQAGKRVTDPERTLLVLISDLREGGDDSLFIRRCAELSKQGVRLVVLPALSNQGKPAYHTTNAQRLAGLHIPTFTCTPQYFPRLMAQALQGKVPSPES